MTPEPTETKKETKVLREIVVGAKPAEAAKEAPKKEEPKKEEVKKEEAKKDVKKSAAAAEIFKNLKAVVEEIKMIPLGDIVSLKEGQPRKIFEREALKGLADSIDSLGVLEPIICTIMDGKVTIVSGERRFRAAKLAAQKTIPVRFMDNDPVKIRMVQYVENMQREDLHPLEEALGLKAMLGTTMVLPGETEPTKMNIKGLAKFCGKTAGYVSQRLSLLELPRPVQEALFKNEITISQARELQTVTDEKEQLKLLNKIKGSDEAVRVKDLKSDIDKAKAKRRTAEGGKEGKGRGRPPREETTAPNIGRQGLDKALEHLNNAKLNLRKVTEVREGMAMVYERFDKAKSDEKKVYYKGAIAALEWASGFREDV